MSGNVEFEGKDPSVYFEPVDPYLALARRHKLPFYYTLEWCGFSSRDVLVRHDVNTVSLKKDPQFFALSDPDWQGEPFEHGDDFPEKAIATPEMLFLACKRKLTVSDSEYYPIDLEMIDVESEASDPSLPVKEKVSVNATNESKENFLKYMLPCKRRKHLA